MFVSFFPQPRLFFLSAAGWSILLVLVWFFGGANSAPSSACRRAAPGAPPVIGVAVFWSTPFIWFYIYFAVAVAIFAAFWRFYAPHPWRRWSILGSALILFTTYFQVQVSASPSTTGTGRSTI